MNKQTIKQAYRAPEVKKYGDFRAITQGNSSGGVLDRDFPVGTPKGDITFS
jgi:hypothetical protein